MNGLLDGFRVGYGVVDNYMDKKDSREFRDQQYADQKQRQGLQDKRQSEIDGMNRSEHAVKMADYGLGLQQKEKQLASFDEDRELNVAGKKASNTSLSLGNTVRKKQIDAYDDKEVKAKQAQSATNITNAIEMNKVGGEVDWNALSRDMESLQGTQWGFLWDGKQQAALKSLTADISKGTITSETLQLLNNGGMPEIKKAIGKPSRFGSPISDVAIAGLEPSKDGKAFSIRLLVRDEAGNTYQSAVNEGRDADSPLKEIGTDKILQHLTAQNAILDEAERSGFIEKLGQHKAMQMQSSSKGGTPAKIQEYEYLQNMLGQEGFERWLTTSKGKDQKTLEMNASVQAYKIVEKDMSLIGASDQEVSAAVQRVKTMLLNTTGDSQQGGLPQNGGQQIQQGQQPIISQDQLNQIIQGITQLENGGAQ